MSYSYRVRAYNSTVESGYSNTATVITSPNTIPPPVPTRLIATVVSSSRIDLSWTPSTGGGSLGVAGYNVYQAGWLIRATVRATFSVKGLSANTPYCFSVTAYDRVGNGSAQSDQVCATTKPASPPDDPSKADRPPPAQPDPVEPDPDEDPRANSDLDGIS